MYPAELEIKDTTESNTSAYYLDLLLSIESDGQLRTSLYDKRDDFNFRCDGASVLLYFTSHITNFPFLSSNIPSSPAYGVFISQLIRYARACSSYECFILRAERLSSKLLGHGYVMERLKSSLRKFYGRYGDLIKHYEVSPSQMLHDILGHDHVQLHPQLIRHYTNLRTYYRTGLYYRFWPYYQIWRFPWKIATGAASQQRTLTPPDTWSCPIRDLLFFLMLRQFFSELVMSTDLLSLEHPSVLLFCFGILRKYLLSISFWLSLVIPLYNFILILIIGNNWFQLTHPCNPNPCEDDLESCTTLTSENTSCMVTGKTFFHGQLDIVFYL